MTKKKKKQSVDLPSVLVTEARTWLNTKFQHQGRIKGLGVDCVGFISEVAKAAGIDVAIPHDYRPHEDGLRMLGLLKNHMELVDAAQPGDVIALIDSSLTHPEIPRHLAFVTNVTPKTTFIIHASENGRVSEHRMDAHWNKRIHSIWRLKNA